MNSRDSPELEKALSKQSNGFLGGPFLGLFFSHMYMCGMVVHGSTVSTESRRSGLWEVQLQVVGSHPTWVIRTERGSPAIVLNH